MDTAVAMRESLLAFSVCQGSTVIMLGGRGRLSQGSCTHSKTNAITSAGIERIVCESCANVSFMFLDNMKDDIDRLVQVMEEVLG